MPATEWCQRYLPCYLLLVSNSVCFFYVGSQAAAAAYMYVHGLPNIGHRTLPEMWEVRSLYAAYSPWERLWIDFNGKMEIKYPVEGYFDSEFRAICNHCGVMVTWSRKAFLFWKKPTLTGKFFNYVPKESFTASPIDVIVFKFCEMLPTENQWNRAFITWPKNSAASQTVAISRIAPIHYILHKK